MIKEIKSETKHNILYNIKSFYSDDYVVIHDSQRTIQLASDFNFFFSMNTFLIFPQFYQMPSSSPQSPSHEEAVQSVNKIIIQSE